MQKKYCHLTEKERDKISVLHSQGKKPSEIASIIGRNRSTISRELKKKTSVFFRGIYLSSQSHQNIKRNWKNSHKKQRMQDERIKQYVLEKLEKYWTPELISGRIKLDLGLSISHEAIYQYIYDGNLDLVRFLPRKHLSRKKKWKYRKPKRTHIPNRIPIENRPAEANNRTKFGHFEADCIESKRGGSKTALLVITDRLTRLVRIKKLARKTAEQASNAIIFALKNLNTINLNTITYDNGSEFSYHEKINQELKTKSFFCNPYHSWEKGTVENINGLIRRFFPKRTDFDIITNRDIQYVENWINSRPMKCLGFKTPHEKFQELQIVAVTC
jgi:transposase, IS30 family